MMSDVQRFELDAEVRCSDGPCGQLRRVVVDPVARAVTHLVVEPAERWGLGRLVAVDTVEAANPEVTLRCTRSEFDSFEHAEESQFLPGPSGEMGYGSEQMLFWPYYGLDIPRMDGLAGFGGNAVQPVLHDTRFPSVRWKCAGVTRCKPPMAASGEYRAWSSIRTIIT